MYLRVFNTFSNHWMKKFYILVCKSQDIYHFQLPILCGLDMWGEKIKLIDFRF